MSERVNDSVEAYFVGLSFYHVDSEGYTSERPEWEHILARVEGLSKDSAKTLAGALTKEVEQAPFGTRIWMMGEAKSKTDPGGHLWRCVKARETDTALREGNFSAGDLLYSFAETVRRYVDALGQKRPQPVCGNVCSDEAYFVLVSWRQLEDVGTLEWMDGTDVVARTGALNKDSAAMLMAALTEEAEEISSGLNAMREMPCEMTVSVMSETESTSDPAGHLRRCVKLRETDAVLEDTTFGNAPVCSLARAARRYIDALSQTTPPSAGDSNDTEPTRFEVYDHKTEKVLVFDETDTEHWRPIHEGADLEVTLYRHGSGHWTLVTNQPPGSCSYDHSGGLPKASCLSDAEATYWLVRNGCEVPPDVAHLAPEAFYAPDQPAAKHDIDPPPERPAPRWDNENRELWFGETLCKRFRQPAPNQTRLLADFEELGWPPRIDDPISPSGGVDPRQRLRDTVRGLNTSKENDVIRFELDGTGEGVIWKPTPELP